MISKWPYHPLGQIRRYCHTSIKNRKGVSMQRYIIIVFGSLIICLFQMTGWSAPETHSPTVGSKRVLVLFSYNYNYVSQQKIIDGLESARKTADMRSCEFVHEYLDFMFKDKELSLVIRNLLLKKYEKQRFDLIITIYEPALDFLLNEGKDFLPESPCLAIFAIERPNMTRAGQPVIQIPLRSDPQGTLELALKFFPKTRGVCFVSGANQSDKSFETQARIAFAPWQRKLEFNYTSDRSVDEVMKKVAILKPGNIVIYSRVSSDITGKQFVPSEIAYVLAKVSAVPVFCLTSSHIDTGAIGGSLIDFEALGSMLNRTIVTLGEGTPLAIESASQYIRPMFDWNEIRHWKIDTDLLPTGSVIINRSPTLWDQYKQIVIGVLMVFVTLTGLIVALMIKIRNASLIAEIEERKQVQKMVQSANAYNRGLIEASLDPLLTIGPDGRITDVNLATEYATGCRREELIGTDFADYFTEPERARAGYQQVFKEGCVQDYELNIRRRDGSTMPVRYNASIYKDNKDQLLGVFAAARDITRIKQAEEERFALERKLLQAKKAESLGCMAGAIAHHYNNLLSVVMGNLELFMEFTPLAASDAERLTEAMKAARRAADLSSLMLTFLGQASGNQEPMDLSDICRGCLPTLQESIPKKVNLEVNLLSSGPAIKANTFQIRQVLTHLITNAVEAIGENGGFIHLNVKTVLPVEIPEAFRRPLEWQPQDNLYACLEVADSGCGISTETMDKLFDPFFTSKFTGRGLGLPVVLGIVKAHGGAVAVESRLNQGSVFRVILPISVENMTRKSEMSASSHDIVEGIITVLLVEDDPAVRKMTRAMLDRLGFIVLEAKDGVEALDVYKQNKDVIRVVLSDLTMPRMDGWATIEALHRIDPNLPVILASGYDQAQVMEGDHSDLPQAFLNKPYQLSELSETIRNVLKKMQMGG